MLGVFHEKCAFRPPVRPTRHGRSRGQGRTLVTTADPYPALPDWLLIARSNAYGLTRDAAILGAAIEAAGSESEFASTRARGTIERLLRRRRARGILHIERAFPRWYSAAAERNWLVPNQERFPRRHIGRLDHIDRVLTKTRHAEQIFTSLGLPVVHLGFTSPDRRDIRIPRDWTRFFHLAGGSTLKGTEDILSLWAKHPDWPELVLVQKAANAPISVPGNVTLAPGYLDDAGLSALQNRCGVHLCPSRAEGWGHHIVEALSVGAVTLVTDAPPMNEHVDAGCGVLVRAVRSEPRHLGTSHFVDHRALEAAVEAIIAMPASRKGELGDAARRRFEAIDRDFKDRAKRIFAPS